MKNNLLLQKANFVFCFLFILFSFNAFAQVGIGTTEPTTMLEVNGALSLRESPTPLTLVDGTNTDIDLGTTPYSQYNITGPTGAFAIDGVTRINAAADGQIVRLINTTDQAMTIVHSNVGDLRIFCPNETNLILTEKYASVTLQYNKTLARWTVASYSSSSPSIDSVTLAADRIISNISTFTAVTGMSLTFKARKAEVLVMLTGSGQGYSGAASVLDMRVNNTTTTTTVGGTRTIIHSMTKNPFNSNYYYMGAWSCSFSKLLTGLTVGTTYTLTVEGKINRFYGNFTYPSDAVIQAATSPDTDHLTLSVLQ